MSEPGKLMTDAEVICGWMEPKPTTMPETLCTPLGWWECRVVSGKWTWVPTEWASTLDALREVEERLTKEQWRAYWDRLVPFEAISGVGSDCYLIHLSAEQKIKALAQTIREATDAR